MFLRVSRLTLPFVLWAPIASAQTPEPPADPPTVQPVSAQPATPATPGFHPTVGAYPLPDFALLEPGYVPPPAPRRPAHWIQTTAVGASVGLGAPYGYAGAFLLHNPVRWAQMEMGAGYSAPFGPSVGFMGRLGIDPGNDSFASLGIGFSVNFTDYDYVTNCIFSTSSFGGTRETCTPSGTHRNAHGTAYPLFFNFELAEDLRSASDIGTRFAIGASIMTNPGAFPAALGCPTDTVGRTACDVGVGRTDGSLAWQLYIHLDLYLVVVNGLSGATVTPAPTPAPTSAPPRSR